MKLTHGILPLLILTIGSLTGIANATIVQFDFKLFDSESTLIGTGFYRFDDVPQTSRETRANIDSLSSFSWEFQIPSASVFISSANGGRIPHSQTDPPFTEIIILIGEPGSRNLVFENEAGIFVGHTNNNNSQSISFQENTNIVTYPGPGGSSPANSFTAIESIPEPSSALFLGLSAVGFIARRRRTNST